MSFLVAFSPQALFVKCFRLQSTNKRKNVLFPRTMNKLNNSEWYAGKLRSRFTVNHTYLSQTVCSQIMNETSFVDFEDVAVLGQSNHRRSPEVDQWARDIALAISASDWSVAVFRTGSVWVCFREEGLKLHRRTCLKTPVSFCKKLWRKL